MYLYGASGHAKVIIDILKANGVLIDGLIDDNPDVTDLQGYPVFHQKENPFPLIISIGNNGIRKRISERLIGPYGKAIHPSSVISPSATIGDGTVVMQGTIVQANAWIGKHCIVNTGASIDHECQVGDFVHVSPHCTLCGNVHVGEGTWVGAGSTVIQGVHIGHWSVIGAGTVVTKDIPDGVLVIGNRTLQIKDLDAEMLNKPKQREVKYLIKPILAVREVLLNQTERKERVNILITSAGKRVKLVQLFQQELRRYFLGGKVYTTDMNPTLAPAGYVSDKCFQVSKVTDQHYLSQLLTICRENDIRLVIPTIDTELQLLAKCKEQWSVYGIDIMVSAPGFVEACRDKRNTNALFAQLNIRIPEPRDKWHPIFPMFAKPYDGSLSKDLFVLHKQEDLTAEILTHPKLIFMEYIDKSKYKEYTVDLYYGKDNRLKCIVPRERIEIRAGEISKGYTRKNYLVGYIKERMDYMPGVIGCICIQLFYREENQDVVGIEINPRFGGGYPLSYYAKANFPQYMIREYCLNEEIEYSQDWLDNTLMLRYDSQVVVYEKEQSRCV